MHRPLSCTVTIAYTSLLSLSSLRIECAIFVYLSVVPCDYMYVHTYVRMYIHRYAPTDANLLWWLWISDRRRRSLYIPRFIVNSGLFLA